MPNYPGSGQAVLLHENEQKKAWDAERIFPTQASVALQLTRIRHAFYPWGVSYELSFSADPGAFQIDIQHSDSDEDAKFVTMHTITSGLNTNFVTRLELPQCYAKFVRAIMVSITNDAVLTTLQVTR